MPGREVILIPMTPFSRSLTLLLLAGFCLVSRGDETAELSTSLEEMATLLSAENPCPVGEAEPTIEWKLCVERWERLKTEELYLPIQNAKAPTRDISSEEPPAPAEPDVHQN